MNQPYAAWNATEQWANDVKPQKLFCDNGPGWMVCILTEGSEWFIPLKFARKVDADIAAESIRDIIDWNGTMEQIGKRLRAYGLQKLRQRMTENLMW